MQNGVLTRWELIPEEKFEDFLIELLDYLKNTLVPIEVLDEQFSYTCTKHNYNKSDYMKPFERVANFCMEKNLNPHEVIDMIDEYTGERYSCECYLIRDKKIRKLIEKNNNNEKKSFLKESDSMVRKVVQTKSELARDDKFENFCEELKEYLKKELMPYNLSKDLSGWECDFNHGDFMYGSIHVDPFVNTKYFCKQKQYDWNEAFDLIIDYTGHWPMCDCDILEDLIEVSSR